MFLRKDKGEIVKEIEREREALLYLKDNMPDNFGRRWLFSYSDAARDLGTYLFVILGISGSAFVSSSSSMWITAPLFILAFLALSAFARTESRRKSGYPRCDFLSYLMISHAVSFLKKRKDAEIFNENKKPKSGQSGQSGQSEVSVSKNQSRNKNKKRKR